VTEPFDWAVCTRSLTLRTDGVDEQVHVEVGPLKQGEGDTFCRIHITQNDNTLDDEIYGLDGVQAMQLALRFAGSTDSQALQIRRLYIR
jgi:hypothetical protein